MNIITALQTASEPFNILNQDYQYLIHTLRSEIENTGYPLWHC